MNTSQFKVSYFLQKDYRKVSPIEFYCKLTVISKSDEKEVTGIETKINLLEIDQQLADSQFGLTPVTWEMYMNETISILFYYLMLRVNVQLIDNIISNDQIAEFFNENPFH
jgi:hypothetical protein